MISSKFILAIFVALAISNSIVESCNSDTGSSAASSCSAGSKGLDCSDNCACNKTLLMTCIDKQCACNLKSQGAFGHSCSADCACQKSAGLICLKGTCKCNATAALWDTDKCYNIETVSENCDALIVEPADPGRRKRALTGDAQFVTVASEDGWKCVVSTTTLYSPSYSEAKATGKYTYEAVLATASEATSNCTAKGGIRAQPSTDDALETLLLNYGPAAAWVGIYKDNKDGKFYYDNSTLTDLTVDDTAVMGCVTINTNIGGLTYVSADCATASNYICQF